MILLNHMKKDNKHLYTFAAFGKMSAGILHDMASPMTTISLSADRLRKCTRRGYRIDGDIEAITRASETMKDLMASTRYALKQPQEKTAVFNVTEEVKAICTMCQPRTDTHGIKLIFSKQTKPLYTEGHRVRFHQVILNLVSNAIEALQGRFVLEKRLIVVKTYATRKHIKIRVKDNGSGIQKHVAKHIFDPFFSTKNTHGQNSTGIGLSHVREIIEQEFGGTISLTSHFMPTCFTVTMPRTQEISLPMVK